MIVEVEEHLDRLLVLERKSYGESVRLQWVPVRLASGEFEVVAYRTEVEGEDGKVEQVEHRQS